MEISNLVKYEYFELVKKLNHTNKLKNQQTDIFFYIDSNNLNHLKLYVAISYSQRILICEKLQRSTWFGSGYSGFSNLEDFIAGLFEFYKPHENLTDYIKSHIFELVK